MRMAVRHFNKCGKFDGIDDTVNCGNDNSLNFSNALTLECWAFPTSFGGGNKGRIVDRSVNAAGYLLYLEETVKGLRITINDINYTSESNIIELNKWQHIMVTFDKDLASDQIKFYVNNILKGTATKTAAVNSNDSIFRIGYGKLASRLFAGRIGEVRAYSRGLTEEEKKQRYFNDTMITDGLVSYWDFDNNTNDKVGSNNGTITGMIYSSDTAFKKRVAISSARNVATNRIPI